MARSRQRRKPSFFWQALLILLPVAVLATVGFLSLRQDKIIAQHEAADRAQTIADSLLPRFWSALTNLSNPQALEHHAFQVDPAGNLLFPPPLSPTPAPKPLDPADLTAEQTALWLQAERAETTDQENSSVIKVLHAFLSTKPPDRFAAIATYSLGILLEKRDPRDSAHTLLTLLDNYPHNIAESGLSLDDLAEFKLLELSITIIDLQSAKVVISGDDFCRRIIFDPSPLTPPLVSWVSAHAEALGLKHGNAYWNSLWREYEESRQLYENARPNLMSEAAGRAETESGTNSQVFWFNNAGENCLAIRLDEATASQESRSGNAFNGRGPRFGTTGESSRRIKSKMDLQPESGKNSLTSPNPNHNEPAGLRTSSSGKSFYGGGTAEQNGMSLPDFSGPATILRTRTTNPWFLCRTESEVGHALFSVPDMDGQLPEYFGIAVEVGGKRLREAAPDLRTWRKLGFFEGGRQKGQKLYVPTIATNVLASAVQSENGSEQLRLSVYLTSASTLFKRQSERTSWFCSLIAAAAVAALIGLLSAWRAFNRQQELTEMKTNFVSSVSHELRAPIASVRLMAESLERGKIADAPKQHEYFRFIGQECRRLSSLIENVLDFSRIEQGRKQYEFEPTDLLALVRQTVKLMEAYGFEKQVAIALTLPGHQPSTFDYQLSVDGRAIQQALINLLDNAIKHSPNGQTITVELNKVEKLNHLSCVNVAVIDSGPGIPPEEHEKIFERFYRLGSELRRETQGVGIGLSIVKHIVEAHHGRVLVQSAPGQGSRFTIELPAERANGANT